MRSRGTGAVALVLALGALVPGAARAAHEDGIFEQPVWFEWSTATLDVLIVPPEHGQVYNNNGALGGLDPAEANPLANSYLRAIERSVADWDRAVTEYGTSWLASGLITDVYVVGRDPIPEQAMRNPEVVIVTDQSKASILGVAFNTRPCLVVNSKFFVRSMNYEDMFNINAQEYGHCLGLNHVPGDAKGTAANGYRDGDLHDPMNGAYPHTPGSAGTDLHCMSNLNVKGLERSFARALGQFPRGGIAELPVDDYVRPATC